MRICSRRSIVAAIALTILMTVTASGQERRPNVVFFLVDDLGWRDLGAETLEREAIYWHFPHYSNHGMQSPGGAIRAGDYKLLEYFENGTVQLFDLSKDVGEQNDLSQAMPEKVAQLRSMLSNWREEVSARTMQPNPEYTRKNDP